jgi:tetratricopeptide (TPR) repeat protein
MVSVKIKKIIKIISKGVAGSIPLVGQSIKDAIDEFTPDDKLELLKELKEISQNQFTELSKIGVSVEDLETEIVKSLTENNSKLNKILEISERSIAILLNKNQPNSEEQQQLLEKSKADVVTIREKLHTIYILHPAEFLKELEEEEKTKTLEQLSKEADEQQERRKELEVKEKERNAGIKYSLSLQQAASFKYTEALSSIKRAIELWPDNPEFILRLSALLFDIGLLQEAERTLASIVKTKDIESSEYDFQKSVWNIMGNIQMGLLDPDRAIISYEMALGLQFQQHGKVIYLGAEMLFTHLGTAYLKVCNWERATYYLTKSLEATKIIYGDESLGVAHCLNSLGDLYQAQGKWDEARIQFELALDIFNKLKISVHPGLATLHDNLSSVYRHLDKLEESLHFAQSSLSGRISIYGEKNIHTATSYLVLARVYKALKEDEKALDNFTIAALIYEGESIEGRVLLSLERKHGLVETYIEKANHLMDMRRWKEAIPFLKMVRNIHTIDFGENSIPVATVLSELGACQFNSDNPKDAIVLWQEAKSIFEATEGFQKDIDALVDNISYANEIMNSKT